MKPLLLLLPAALLVSIQVQLPPGAPPMEVDALAAGPYSTARMLLEKTVFGFDVLTVEVRFDSATQERIRKAAGSKPVSADLIDQVALAAVDASDVFARLEFLRNVSLDRWVEGASDGLRKGWQAGIIDEETYRYVAGNLAHWFRGISERGFRRGDQVLYRGYPDRLRTVLVSNSGEVLLDQTDQGASHRRALLAGYFAPGTDFREPLVRSLLNNERLPR